MPRSAQLLWSFLDGYPPDVYSVLFGSSIIDVANASKELASKLDETDRPAVMFVSEFLMREGFATCKFEGLIKTVTFKYGQFCQALHASNCLLREDAPFDYVFACTRLYRVIMGLIVVSNKEFNFLHGPLSTMVGVLVLEVMMNPQEPDDGDVNFHLENTVLAQKLGLPPVTEPNETRVTIGAEDEQVEVVQGPPAVDQPQPFHVLEPTETRVEDEQVEVVQGTPAVVQPQPFRVLEPNETRVPIAVEQVQIAQGPPAVDQPQPFLVLQLLRTFWLLIVQLVFVGVLMFFAAIVVPIFVVCFGPIGMLMEGSCLFVEVQLAKLLRTRRRMRKTSVLPEYSEASADYTAMYTAIQQLPPAAANALIARLRLPLGWGEVTSWHHLYMAGALSGLSRPEIDNLITVSCAWRREAHQDVKAQLYRLWRFGRAFSVCKFIVTCILLLIVGPIAWFPVRVLGLKASAYGTRCLQHKIV